MGYSRKTETGGGGGGGVISGGIEKIASRISRG